MARHQDAETLRILARYRRLLLLGRAHLSLGQGLRLLGPDRAYQFYSGGLNAPGRRRPARRMRG
jgi:hypothetical protein